MNGKILNPKFVFLTIVILLAAMTRVLPHPPNFTAIGAIALLGGALYSDKRTAFIIPFAAMFLADLFIGFHNTMWAVYLSFAISVMIGFTLRNNLRITNLVIASVTSSLLFFVITNFAVWYGSAFYAQDINGLVACIASAVPFYKNDIFGSFFLNTIFGDLVYTGLLFGAFWIMNIQFPKLQLLHVRKK